MQPHHIIIMAVAVAVAMSGKNFAEQDEDAVLAALLASDATCAEIQKDSDVLILQCAAD